MSDKSRNLDRLVLGAPPRADLLPPELKAEEKLHAQRRGLVAMSIFVVVLVGLAYGYLAIEAGNSAQRLAAANASTASLLAEQAKYSEVTLLNARLAMIKTGQQIGVSTEIDWRDYLQQVQASLPAGTGINSVGASTAGPGAGVSAPSSPLLAASIAELTFAATTSTLPDVSQWIDNLSLLPGFADAVAGSITLNAEGSYSVTIIMHIDQDALSNRFVEEPETAEGDAAEEDAAEAAEETEE
jgi:Tfp pilus assembly protein PilN